MENKPKIWGIPNITPDSFSDGGKYVEKSKALQRAQILFKNGASFIDIGGESTRPNASEMSSEAEWGRVAPIVEKCLQHYPQQISLDSRHPETVQKFLEMGGTILNDVSGFQHPAMIDLAIEYNALCIVNHFPGKNITEVHEQKISSEMKVLDDLSQRAEIMMNAGVPKSKIILDPGIGFGKTPECNWALLQFAELIPEFPVMIGHSKKRFLGENRFEKNVNQQAAQIAIASGCAYLRVHDPEWYKT